MLARKADKEGMNGRVSEKEYEVTVPAFERWLKYGAERSKFVYHRGNLAVDREEVSIIPALSNRPAHVFIEPFNTLGQMAWYAYLKGEVVLGQKKLDDGRFDYIAFKRKHRRVK